MSLLGKTDKYYLSIVIKWIVVTVLKHLAVHQELAVHLRGLVTQHIPFKATKLKLFQPLEVQNNLKQVLRKKHHINSRSNRLSKV